MLQLFTVFAVPALSEVESAFDNTERVVQILPTVEKAFFELRFIVQVQNVEGVETALGFEVILGDVLAGTLSQVLEWKNFICVGVICD